MTKKDIVILVDNTTIKKDIKLLFSFTNLTSVDPQRVAYKVANVDYKPGILQPVPVSWEST
ncbi:hypothetical protein H0H93_003803 [Arthromyces matolae]|nr:hypothetical protein H0H93_003803 [Arthromyces matolae]